MPAAHNTLCMHTPLTFAEILSALSHALDITEGQPRGHAVRTAYLALRIGKELHLPDTDMRDLYKASLLKDAGCSSNAVRVYKVFAADDLLTKRSDSSGFDQLMSFTSRLVNRSSAANTL